MLHDKSTEFFHVLGISFDQFDLQFTDRLTLFPGNASTDIKADLENAVTKSGGQRLSLEFRHADIDKSLSLDRSEGFFQDLQRII